MIDHKHIIVCDGCLSNLRKSLSAPKVESPSCFVGLILENCELPHANHGHVILGDPSRILFYPISSTEVRCLVDVPGTKVPSVANGEMANYLKTMVAAEIPPQLHNAFMVTVEKGNIRTMQNKSMAANPVPTPGAILLGDAFNMRHPLTGGGMTVALSDIVLLRDLLRPLCDLNDAPALCNYLESFYTLHKVLCTRCFVHHLIRQDRKCAKHVLAICALEASVHMDQYLFSLVLTLIHCTCFSISLLLLSIVSAA
ncbi:squalene monooxygenase SE1-like [Rosa rugosa]|uniref:squalene monooxygenase SE1-like n=1 Tax=Rosa rugosa TaxID=74645 RepID=UPI002B40D919|nr:squalene monooxygenase SE1-like [Rosa rugosa]